WKSARAEGSQAGAFCRWERPPTVGPPAAAWATLGDPFPESWRVLNFCDHVNRVVNGHRLVLAHDKHWLQRAARRCPARCPRGGYHKVYRSRGQALPKLSNGTMTEKTVGIPWFQYGVTGEPPQPGRAMRDQVNLRQARPS